MNYENVLEIDLNKTFSGHEVNNLVNIVLEEADIIIKETYAEGYKQATLELKPELNYYKSKYEQQKKTGITKIITTIFIGFSVGYFCNEFIK